MAAPGACLAHGIYVEPWMHAANLTLSMALATASGLLLKRRTGAFLAACIGLCVLLLCSFGGLILSIILSM